MELARFIALEVEPAMPPSGDSRVSLRLSLLPLPDGLDGSEVLMGDPFRPFLLTGLRVNPCSRAGASGSAWTIDNSCDSESGEPTH